MALFSRRRRRSWDDDGGRLAYLITVLFPPTAELERRERLERERRAHEVRRRWAQVERRIADSRRGIEFDARAAARAEELRTAGAPEARTSRFAQNAAQRSVQARVIANPVRTDPVTVAAQQQAARDQAARIATQQRAAFFA